MMSGTVKIEIKEWLYNKTKAEAKLHHLWVDKESAETEGYIGCLANIIAETEKAIKVNLHTGFITGTSVKGWNCWLPKSQIVVLR